MTYQKKEPTEKYGMVFLLASIGCTILGIQRAMFSLDIYVMGIFAGVSAMAALTYLIKK